MDSERLFMPEPIPGIIRRCSPVYLGGTRSTVVGMPEDDAVFVAGWSKPVPVGMLLLDLDDPTGVAHAAWWLADRWLQVGGGPHVGWHWYGLRDGWGLYAEGDHRSFGAIGSGADVECPRLTGMSWVDDEASGLALSVRAAVLDVFESKAVPRGD